MTRSPTLALPLVLLAAACSEPTVPVGHDDGFDEEHEIVVDILPSPVTAIDFLFVIDSSGSMAEEQAALALNTRDRLLATFSRDFQRMPDIHMGVISTDMGAGPFNISGCEGTGDNGEMLIDGGAAGCTPPRGNFIVDVDDGTGTGGRIRNYDGGLAETFACMARLGIDGCGFEQPLEAMRRALSPDNAANEGFLRDDAMLAILFLTDEDDCSAFDTSVFDTAQNTVNDPLGPLSSFRCFEFGVICDGDDPRAPGVRENCRPREDSPYITPVSEYVAFLNAIKPDPSLIVVGAMVGDATPVVVGLNQDGNPELQASCESDLGQAAASPRLNAFVRSFPGRFQITSICSDDNLTTETYRSSAVVSGTSACRTCLVGEVADVDPATAALDVDCRVYDAVRRGATDEVRTPVEACADTNNTRPCYTLAADDACDYTSTGLAVEVHRNGDAPEDSNVLVRCVTPALLSKSE